MGAHKTTVVKNTFKLSILGTLAIGDVADWKINGLLEYFRYMGILQNQTTIAILLIPTVVFRNNKKWFI